MSASPLDPNLLTREQAANVAGIGLSTLDQFRRQGRVRPVTWVGRTPLYDRAALEQLATERRAGGRVVRDAAPV